MVEGDHNENKKNYWLGSVNQVINAVKSNEGVSVYPIISDYGPEKAYTVLGRQKDGNYVKFFDTDAITAKYFGNGRNGMPPVVYTKLTVA